MEFIIDVQGLKLTSNDFAIKELAIVAVNGSLNQPVSYVFKPPCAWEELPHEARTENHWLERHFHGLGWDFGNIAYEEIPEILERFETL